MKRTSVVTLVLLTVAMVAMVGLGSCKKERNKSKLLIKKWTMEKVEVAGVDVSSAFAGATFDFKSDETYVTTYKDDDKTGVLARVLPKSGKWNMAEDGTWVKLDGVK